MKHNAMALFTKRRTDYIHVKNLMERIILQSIEDLWVSGEKDDCINFFRGEGFAVCAYIAGLETYDKVRLINLADKIFNFQSERRKKRKDAGMKEETLTSGVSGTWNMKLSTTAKQKNLFEACLK